jgi:hypothetical protein
LIYAAVLPKLLGAMGEIVSFVVLIFGKNFTIGMNQASLRLSFPFDF